MKIIGYTFGAGALLYLSFAFMALISLQINIYIWSVLSLAALFPIIFYLVKCPSNMPLKTILWTFVLFSIFINLLSVDQHQILTSQDYSLREKYEHYMQTYGIIQYFNTATLTILKLIIFGQIIKLSKKFSFVWWSCILNFIIALSPIITPLVIIVYSRDYYIEYMTATNLIHNLGFALLYLSLGLFFMPQSKHNLNNK
jgi:hypothetical protein